MVGSLLFFFFKQKTAYELRISDWSSDVCSSDLARVMSAYCKHMGADLSVGGDIVGNDVRCPYHHWTYGDGGKCTGIASGDPIPRASNLASFPTAEHLGRSWVFFGETPLYAMPPFDEYNEKDFAFGAYEIDVDFKLMVVP